MFNILSRILVAIGLLVMHTYFIMKYQNKVIINERP